MALMVTETLSIKVSKAEKNLLRECARRSRRSASDLLRQALHSVVRSPQAAGASLLERHAHLFEDLDRGPGDLSSNKHRLRGYGR
jgi:hypothetical protein